MSVYVGPLRTLLPSEHRGYPHDTACHLMADSDDELEAFARKLKCRRSWRHGDHYDLTRNKRLQAVAKGAIEVSDRDLVVLRKSLDAARDARRNCGTCRSLVGCERVRGGGPKGFVCWTAARAAKEEG